MRTCLLHIGGHKTATSAMQKALASSQQLLNEIGWFFSVACKHTSDFSSNSLPIAVFSGDHIKVENQLNALKNEISSTDYNMIFSSELLEKIPLEHKDFCNTFIMFLKQHFSTILIVYSIRDIIDWSSSIFKQMLCNPYDPYRKTTDEYTRFITSSYPKVSTIVNSWKDMNIDDFYMYWYSSDFEKNIKNILSIADINIEIKNPGLINKSIDGNVLKFIYHHNIENPQYNTDQKISFIRELRKFQYKLYNTIHDYKTCPIPKELHKSIISEYLADIDRIKDIHIMNTNNCSKNYGIFFTPMTNIEYEYFSRFLVSIGLKVL